MRIRYYQGEVFYPRVLEPNTTVSSIDMMILRLTDGYWWDFNDSSFKNTGWTTPTQALSEEAVPSGSGESTWIWTTGWTLPSADAEYAIVFRDNDNYIYEGPTLVVNDAEEGRIIFTVQASPSPSTTAFGTGITWGDADQVKDRFILFDDDTTTTALQGQAKKITASTTAGVLTVDTLTSAPSSGDTGIIF